MTQHIVGVWHLDAFHDVDEAGRPVGEGPLGPAPSGMLIYTPDGHVSVSMMPTGHSGAPGPSYMGYAGEWWEQVRASLDLDPESTPIGEYAGAAAEH